MYSLSNDDANALLKLKAAIDRVTAPFRDPAVKENNRPSKYSQPGVVRLGIDFDDLLKIHQALDNIADEKSTFEASRQTTEAAKNVKLAKPEVLEQRFGSFEEDGVEIEIEASGLNDVNTNLIPQPKMPDGFGDG